MTGIGPGTRILHRQQDVSLAVNAFVVADTAAQAGNENAVRERTQHLRTIQARYWRLFYSILSGTLARRRTALEFADDERLFTDIGLVDPRMLSGNFRTQLQTLNDLTAEVKSKNLSGCYFLSEWLANRQHQLQLEFDITEAPESEDDKYAQQLGEARRRVLSRLAPFFTGLPGVPLEVSEAMRTGDLDRVIIAGGIAAIREPRRKTFLRRHHLWALREQILAKARARANNQGALRLFEMLNEVYTREWRARYEAYLAGEEEQAAPQKQPGTREIDQSVSVTDPNVDAIMREARQIRMRMTLMSAIDGKTEPDTVFYGDPPRLTKASIADFLPLAQAFDRSLVVLPPIIIVPGSGRGFFTWQTGTILLAHRPMVGVDDSVATALAWLRILDDKFNQGGVLRAAFEKRFPGAVFQNDFPADYRAWLTRLTKGEVNAMQPARRAFFREMIGPDLSGPMLPPNLRGVGPQTMVAICRRLEKQIASGEADYKLHRRLASIYWQQSEIEAAGLQFNAAMQLAPEDGETLFIAGMFMRSRGDLEAANECFRYGVERAADSMWGIYCKDALDNAL